MTDTMLAPIAYLICTWKRSVRTGMRMTPPPRPNSAPNNPAPAATIATLATKTRGLTGRFQRNMPRTSVRGLDGGDLRLSPGQCYTDAGHEPRHRADRPIRDPMVRRAPGHHHPRQSRGLLPLRTSFGRADTGIGSHRHYLWHRRDRGGPAGVRDLAPIRIPPAPGRPPDRPGRVDLARRHRRRVPVPRLGRAPRGALGLDARRRLRMGH